ncbi:MAG: hypothetical protein H6721_03375 [Sandaracinus sp.]|nr:hypothetical protein [Sandaracinus sp.]MCB9631174.1 hypothetical protein [Sandaracinus sp.]
MLEGVPFVFRREWSVWEEIRDEIRCCLGTPQTFLRLTGSANTGWSFRTGNAFDPARSDLDLLLIDSGLFAELEVAVNRSLAARTAGEPWATTRWKTLAVADVKRHLKRRFVQLDRLPAKLAVQRRFLRCREAISRILTERSATPTLKKVSFRVYETEDAAIRQLARSLEPGALAA